MCTATLKALKDVLPPRDLQKKATQSSLVLVWRPHEPETVASVQLHSAPQSDDDDDDDDVIVHLFLLYLRPWRPTWTLLKMVEDGTIAKPCVDEGANAGVPMRTHFELLEALNKKKAWSVFILTLRAQDSPLIFAGDFCSFFLDDTSKALGPQKVWQGYRQEAYN